MGPEIVARASPSKSGLGKGLPSGLSPDTPRGLRNTSSELVRPGSRLKKSSTMTSLQIEAEGLS